VSGTRVHRDYRAVSNVYGGLSGELAFSTSACTGVLGVVLLRALEADTRSGRATTAFEEMQQRATIVFYPVRKVLDAG